MNLRTRYAALVASLAMFVAPLVLSAQSSKLDSLNALLRATTEELARARLLHLVAQEHYQRSINDTALSLAQQALSLSKKLGYKEGVANASNIIGNVQMARGEIPDALNAYFTAQKIWEELKDTARLATTLNNIGNVYTEQGKFSLALETHLRTLRLREAIGNKLGIAMSLNNIGSLYHKLGRNDEAMKSYMEAFELAKELGEKRGMGILLNNIGNMHREAGRYDSAIAAYKSSIEFNKELGNKKGVAITLNNIGLVYKEQKKHADAERYHQDALALAEEVKDLAAKVNALRDLGKIYLLQKKYDAALAATERGLEIEKKVSGDAGGAIFYQQLAEIYAAKGDYREAYRQHQLYAAAKDSAVNADVLKKTTELRLQYEAEKKDLEIQSLQTEKEKQTLALENQTFQRNALLGGVILTALLTLTLANRFRLKQKSEAALRQKTLELNAALIEAERQKAEADAQRIAAETQRKLAEEANALKTEFLGIAAHDLKNPLQSIMGFASLLKEGRVSAQQVAEYASIIEQSSKRMLKLITDLLETAAMDAGKLELKLQPADISELVGSVVQTLQAQAEKKKQTIHFASAPAAFALIDIDRMRDVYENLLSNAIKYTPPEKQIWVSVEQRPLSQSQMRRGADIQANINATDVVRVSVRDEGQGLSEEDMKKLFGKFQRLSARPTGGESSTGLGLSIVKQIVELHGGRVWAESEGKGKGSAFVIEMFALRPERDVVSSDVETA